MPKPKDDTHRYHRRLLGSLLALFLTYVAYTEVTPREIVCGGMGLQCEKTVTIYAKAVESYKTRNGRLPLSLDHLVPYYLSEHHLCSASLAGCHSSTPFHITSATRELFRTPTAPERPGYNIIQLRNGQTTYQILCNRAHPEQVGLRGDSGVFVVQEHQQPLHLANHDRQAPLELGLASE